MPLPVWTALIAVIGGTVVFVIGQIFVTLFIERVRMQARTVESIAQALVMYGPEYSTSIERTQTIDEQHLKKLQEASMELRKLGAVLRSSATTLRWYPFFQRIGFVLPRHKIIAASKELIGLSNLIPPQSGQVAEAARLRESVETLLGIRLSG